MGTKLLITYIWIKDGIYIIIESYEQIMQGLKYHILFYKSDNEIILSQSRNKSISWVKEITPRPILFSYVNIEKSNEYAGMQSSLMNVNSVIKIL